MITHLRHPNRRPQRHLDEQLNGGRCRRTSKERYLDERSARQTLAHLAGRDPDPSTLGVYRCEGCGDWHIGHRAA